MLIQISLDLNLWSLWSFWNVGGGQQMRYVSASYPVGLQQRGVAGSPNARLQLGLPAFPRSRVPGRRSGVNLFLIGTIGVVEQVCGFFCARGRSTKNKMHYK